MGNKKKFINTLLIILAFTTIVVIGSVFLIELRDKERKNKQKENNINNDIGEKETYTPPLYKVCDDDSCVYVLGTMHTGDSKIKNLSNKVIDVYKSIDKLVVELDITKESIDQYKYLIEDNKTIEDITDTEFINKLKEFNTNHPAFMYNTLKYFKLGYIDTYLTSFMYLDAGLTTDGVDAYLLNLAHKDNKPIISLETMEEQEKLLFDYSDEFYIKQIESILDNYELGKSSVKLLYEAYIGENIELLKKSLSSELSNEDNSDEYNKYIDDVYTKRNNKMTIEVKEFLKNNDNVLVAVGAAHVISDDGIIDQLDNDYKVERIK